MAAAQFEKDNPPTTEKFILVQPTVQTGIVNHLDSLSIWGIHANRTKFEDQILYPHKGVFGAFASVGYVNFDKLQSASLQKLNLRQQGKYTVAMVDTNFIKTVQQFIPKKGIENYNRANFLNPFLKLYKDMFVEEDAAIGKYHLRYFNYNFYIDQLVFDKERQQAVMQYSYYKSSHEAYFKKSGNEWKLIRSSYRVVLD
jgi:hypothetical protein